MAPTQNPTLSEKLQILHEEKTKLTASFPKIGILVIKDQDSFDWIERLAEESKSLAPLIQELSVFGHFSETDFSNLRTTLSRSPDWQEKINAYETLKHSDSGATQKLGLKHAIERGLDEVIVIQSPSSTQWSILTDLIYEAVVKKHPCTFATLPSTSLLSIALRFFLGIKVHDFTSLPRIFSCSSLQKTPFELNSDGYLFDVELIIQLRVLGISIKEVSISNNSFEPQPIGLFGALTTILRYRFHQTGLLFDKKYLPKGAVLYTIKTSPYSSHGQILKLVKEQCEVLDVGCGTGLLSQRLAQKQVRSLGIDYEIKENVWSGFETYIQDDLEKAEKLPQRRSFDYVLLADVLEHLRTPGELLRKIRPLIKKDGKLIASTGNVALWYMRLSLLLGRFNYGKKGILDETHVKLYTQYSFVQLLTQAGFRVEHILPTSLPFEVVFQSTGKSKTLKAIDSIYYWFARLWPTLFAYQFVIEASIDSLETNLGEGKLPL